MNEERIKLAEAMGWTLDESSGIWPPKGHDCYGTCMQLAVVPDPFTDANDDYAVLEWMRGRVGKSDDEWLPDMEQSNRWFTFVYYIAEKSNYQIGDYARAALKVIE